LGPIVTQPRASPWNWRRMPPEAPCKAALEKKRPERAAPPPPSPWQKGVSIVKEHYCPPRERIPEVDEAVLPVRGDLTDLRQAVVGCGMGDGGGVAGGFGSAFALAFGRRGARPNSTSFSERLP
jgi:hypothetical protein